MVLPYFLYYSYNGGLIIPTKNPKHQKKNIQIQRQHEFSASNFNRRRFLLMSVIFVVVVGVLIVIIVNSEQIFNSNHSNDDTIENGDFVQFSYNIWVDENGDGSATDEWDGGNIANIYYNSSISQIIYYEEDATNNTFSQIFVNDIIGMEIDDSKYITIPGVIDENDDGIDDETGEKIIGFQSYTSLKGKDIIIQVKILDIVKPSDEDYPNS